MLRNANFDGANAWNTSDESKPRATFSSNYDVADVEIAKWIVFDCATAMRLFGGFRYANIDQNLQSVSSRPGNVHVVSETNQVDAYGIRLPGGGPVGGDSRFEKQTADIMLDGLFIRAAYNY